VGFWGEAKREGEGVYVRAMAVDEVDGVAKEWNTGYFKRLRFVS